MQKPIHNENDINSSNKQSSTLDTNKNNIIFYKNGTYFSFGKDNSLNNKLTPNTSSFNFKENIRKSFDATNLNNNSFLNKKRKLMTSEELELEQIAREREEVRKMMKKNMALYYRTKSGTTRIVSKIKDDIYNNNNFSKNIILNNYLNNNSTNNNNQFPIMNKNISNSYAMNFMKEKGINKINDIKKNEVDDKKKDNNKNSKPEQIIEIINTDINPVSVKDKEEEKKDNIIDLFEEKEEVDDKAQENEVNNMVNEEKASNSAIKTPNKESSYLTKIKKLGSMSKLSLCNKIQKYTEICQEVLKEQENKEGGKDKKKKEEKKEEKKGKEKNKKISKNKKNNKK
jgi:hypothetical protein